MNTNEIAAAARTFGLNGDTAGFAAFATEYGFVVQSAISKRNIGRVPMMDLMRAYADGARVRLAA